MFVVAVVGMLWLFLLSVARAVAAVVILSLVIGLWLWWSS